jgi:hypothetical protein
MLNFNETLRATTSAIQRPDTWSTAREMINLLDFVRKTKKSKKLYKALDCFLTQISSNLILKPKVEIASSKKKPKKQIANRPNWKPYNIPRRRAEIVLICILLKICDSGLLGAPGVLNEIID